MKKFHSFNEETTRGTTTITTTTTTIRPTTIIIRKDFNEVVSSLNTRPRLIIKHLCRRFGINFIVRPIFQDTYKGSLNI